MKPVFKCDYCDKMGTEEEIREHETVCTDNYDRRSCRTCVHKGLKSKDGKWYYLCGAGCEIPHECFLEFCPQYERKEKPMTIGEALFGDLFRF